MIYSLIKPLLFSMNPEKAHDLTMQMAKLSPTLGELSGIKVNPRLALRVGSLQWNMPIGLAAGLDKNAEALAFFEAQGFGALECGTITLMPQVGNPKPRMFRYPDEKSLRNSMGFPNQGLLKILAHLKTFEGKVSLGANIGKNKESTAEESINELCLMYETLASEVDYFVVNVSSPNTPGLRAFQEKSYLTELFTQMNKFRAEYKKDLYLKIAPDLEKEKVFELIELTQDMKLSGLIGTNTTIMPDRGMGGISGELLKERARGIRSLILNEKPNFELIGVGGISNFEDLLHFWNEGGKVAQVYTAYVYQGPGLLHHFQQNLIKFLDFNQIFLLQDFFDLELLERQLMITDFLKLKTS